MSTPAINDDSQTVILLCNTTSSPGSLMLWFNGATNAEDGQPPATPSDIATIAPGLQAGPNGYVIWEGNQINGLFPGDRGFHTQIRGTGASQPVSTIVGQGFHDPPFAVPPPGSPPYQYNVFNISRDNDRVVYTDPVLGDVKTIYYCTFAGTTVASVPDYVPIP